MGEYRCLNPLRATAGFLGVIACTLLLHACAGGNGETLQPTDIPPETVMNQQAPGLSELQGLLDSGALTATGLDRFSAKASETDRRAALPQRDES